MSSIYVSKVGIVSSLPYSLTFVACVPYQKSAKPLIIKVLVKYCAESCLKAAIRDEWTGYNPQLA